MAREFLREFFALYKSLPCLWNKKDRKFSDKFQNDLAIMELTKMYRGLSPDATQASVRKELVTFKACLQKEHRRRKEAQKTGLPVNSELWYYDDLSFLLDSNASKPAVVQKAKNWMQAKEAFKSMNDNFKTQNRFQEGEETPMPKRRIVSAAKKPNVKDKYDMLADKLRNLPAEQFSYIENILANIFKFAEHENQEWIEASCTVNSRPETSKTIAANTKTVQSKTFGTQCTQEMQSKTVGTQATSEQTTLNNANFPIIIDYHQLARSSNTSSTTTNRQEAPTPIHANKSKTVAIQTDPDQTDLNRPSTSSSPNMFSQSSQRPGVIHFDLQNLLRAVRQQKVHDSFQ